MQIEIRPYWINRTKTTDGVTHKVMPQQYYGYCVSIYENYSDYANEKEVLQQIIKDLKALTNDLEKNKFKSKKLIKKLY